MNQEQIIKEAKIYLEGDKTVAQTATVCGISKRTFQLHLKQLLKIDPVLHNLVLQKQKSNIIAGRVRGGSTSKRLPSYTLEKAIEVARYIVSQEATYEEASIHFEIPSSTIYDMVHIKDLPDELKVKLELVADANKRNMSTNEYLESRRKL